MKVTARAWTNGTFTIVGDTGYAWDEEGRLSTFDPASVTGAAPTEGRATEGGEGSPAQAAQRGRAKAR